MTAKLAKPRTRAPAPRAPIKFFRVGLTDARDGHQGFVFVKTLTEANTRRRAFKARYPTRAMRRECLPRVDIDLIEVEPTREGILAALNRYASHAENG